MANPLEFQQTIRLQADDLREELSSLAEWESAMKQKNQAVKLKTIVEPALPPIRGTAPLSTTPAAAPTAKPSEDHITHAKDQGNECFKKGMYEDAIRWYTKGINYDPMSSTMHLLYGNRAMCHLKRSEWDKAEQDATTCVQMNRTYSKGFYRRALSRKALGKLKDARADLETVLALVPGDTEAVKELTDVTEKLRRQQKDESTTSAPAKPRKKLVIEEVDDDEDQVSAPASQAGAQKHVDPMHDTEQAARHKHETEELIRAREHEEATRKKKAAEDEALRQRQRRTHSRVEEIVDDEPEPPKKSVASKAPAPAPVIRPRNITTPVFTRDSLAEPKSYTEFQKIYNDIKSDASLWDHYLSLLAASKMSKLFGSSLTPEILVDMLHAAARKPPDQAAELLKGLATVRRIDELIMFFEAPDKEVAKSALKSAEASLTPKDLELLRRLFA